jgi:tachykinin-like receptor
MHYFQKPQFNRLAALMLQFEMTISNFRLFTVNLSIADFMVSTLNVTFNFTYMLYSNWPFGTLYCKIAQFVATLSICASVFTLMAISIDR